jgi:hypothetical protein
MFLQRIRSWLSTFLPVESRDEKETANATVGKTRAQTKPRAASKIAAEGDPEKAIRGTESAILSTSSNSPSGERFHEPVKSQQISGNKAVASEPIDLIIGLDFGTAATKVVIRSPYLPGERARAISFDVLAHRSSNYLLPSRLHLANDGELLLVANGTGKWFTDLKTGMMDQGDARSVATAGVFLALVIREAKLRFLTAEREIYRRYEPRWSLNLGIPSAGYDNPLTRDKFLKAARLAFYLAEGDKPLSLARANEIAGRLEATAGDVERVAVIPEVVAQAIGYARSNLRDPGLHLLVDIGASTLDVCGFFLKGFDGQDNYGLLTATVDRLGVMELHKRRLSALQCEENVQKFLSVDALSILPETFAEYHPGCTCCSRNIDREFLNEVTWIVVRHLAYLKKRRDPDSDRWRAGLPLFLCGGGSSVKLFRYAAAIADEEFRKNMISAPVQIRRLPKPTTLTNQDIGDDLYHRLSVAYGLSFEAFNLGSVSPPSALEDLIPEKSKVDISSRYISKDQV